MPEGSNILTRVSYAPPLYFCAPAILKENELSAKRTRRRNHPRYASLLSTVGKATMRIKNRHFIRTYQTSVVKHLRTRLLVVLSVLIVLLLLLSLASVLLVVRQAIRALRAACARLRQALTQDLADLQHGVIVTDVLVFVLSLGLAASAMVLLRRTFTRFARRLHTQLETLKDTTNQLAEGERAARMPPLGYEELNAVGQTFNRMAQILEEQQQALEEQSALAQQANQSKSAFLASMSHELRTPLNGIIGFSQLLHDEVVGPLSEEQKEYLGDVLASGKHLLALINELLDLAKVEAGKMTFSPEVVNLEQLTGEGCDSLRPLVAPKDIHVSMQVDPTLSEVRLR